MRPIFLSPDQGDATPSCNIYGRTTAFSPVIMQKGKPPVLFLELSRFNDTRHSILSKSTPESIKKVEGTPRREIDSVAPNGLLRKEKLKHHRRFRARSESYKKKKGKKRKKMRRKRRKGRKGRALRNLLGEREN